MITNLRITLASAGWDAIITTDAAIDVIQYSGVSTHYSRIFNLSIQGQDAATTGVHFLAGSAGADFHMYNVLIAHTLGHGIHFECDQGVNWNQKIMACTIEHNHNATDDAAAVFLDGGNDTVFIDNCEFKFCDVGTRNENAGDDRFITNSLISADYYGILEQAGTSRRWWVTGCSIIGGTRAVSIDVAESFYFLHNNIAGGAEGGEVIWTNNVVIWLLFNRISHSPDVDNTYRAVLVDSSNSHIIGNSVTTVGAEQSTNLIFIVSDNCFVSLNTLTGGRGDQIGLGSGAEDNPIINNRHFSVGTACVGGVGVSAHEQRFATIRGEFTQYGGGSVGWTAPVINTSPGGIDIDADDEFAYAHKTLPYPVQQVVKIKIWAYSNVIEAAGNMHLRINIHAGGSSEGWATHVIDQTNVDSEETGGIVVNDVIHWSINSHDYAALRTLLTGEDFLEILAIGEVGAAPDILTDALFGGYVIEYV